MLAGQAWAYDFKSGDLYYNITSDSTVAVTYQFDDSNNYSGLDSITIPEKVIYNEVEYAVTGIGFHAFLYCSGLTSISIPNSVTSIGYLAFYNCNNLHYDEYDNALYIGNVENPYLLLMRVKSTDITSCEINSNCKLVYQSAFEKCSCLTSVTIKSDIDFSSALLCFKKNDICFRVLNKNSVAVFSNSYSGEVVIPATVTAGNTFEVTSIGSSAFADCGGLTSVTIPSSVSYIGSSAFANCEGLTSVTIPNSVTSIDQSAFSGCSNLKTVNFNAKNCTSMGSVRYPVFENCSSLKTLNIGDNVETIPSSAFNNCRGLTSVTIPNSVTNIGNYAFYDCTGFATITIPDSVISIGESAFSGCSGLETITIPESVISIGESAFSGCSGLETVNYNAKNCTSMGSYSYSPFRYCSSLKTLNIGNNVETIPSCAFSKCSSLTSVTIGNSVKNIGSSAFNGCSGLTSVIVPNSVTEIGSAAFGGCTSLESITLPFVGDKTHTLQDTYQYPFGYIFGTGLFTGGTATTQYYYGSSTSSTTSDTYCIPSSLKSVTITGSSYLPYGAFRNCSGLTSVIIPNTVTSIGKRAFYKCNGLISLTIGSSVESIGYEAFSGCGSLTSVTIPNSVTSIDYGAFSSCGGLVFVTIPNTVKSISSYVFSGCGCTIYCEAKNKPSGWQGEWNGNAKVCWGVKNPKFTDDFVCDIINDTESPYQIEICLYRGDSITANIPTSVTLDGKDYEVVSIAKDAFKGYDNLESITISNDVDFSSVKLFFIKDDIRYHVLNKGWVEIVANSYSGGVVIPATVEAGNTFAVKRIADKAFQNCTNLTSIVIGDSVSVIGSNAFDGCSNLTSVTIPEGATTIASNAFSNCPNLDYTAYGNAFYIGNTQNPYKVLVEAKNQKIASCDINSKSQFICDGAFSGCYNLTEITIPNTVESIGQNAFSSCNGLKSVKVGNGVESIGNSAFSGCNSLEKTEFASVEHLCGIKFGNNCSNPLTLAHHLYIDSVEVTNLVISDSVQSIGDYALYNCSNLLSVTIGNSVESIGNYAFYGCNGLTTILIPSSVKSIGAYSFYYCNNLQRTEYASIESLCSIKFGSANANPLSIARQLYISGEKVINLVIPETVSSIGDYAFYNCTSLASITISDSVKRIGTQAFYGCSRLASVEIPNSVAIIGTEAFSGCSYLKSLSYNTNVIGSHFNNISALQSIFIGDSIKAISGSEFNGCDNLVNVISMAAVPPALNGDPYTYADTIYVPAASVDSYKSAPVWKRKEILPLDYYNIQTKADTARGTVSGSGNFAAKQAVTIYATPAENYHFKAWSDGNTENPRTMLVNADLNVTAIFEGDECTVNVSANSLAFGSVVGAESYHYGDTATFTATPVVGYHFLGWSDSVTTNPRVWIVTEDSSFNAVFEINKYAIAASADANGTVVGDSTYNHGTTATLTATANVGYHFVMWSDSVTTNPRNVVATGDSAFTAVFAIDTHTIRATAENGSVTGADTYDYGTEVTITATPTEGYHFVKWSDGNTEATRTIIITEDWQLTAIFEKNEEQGGNENQGGNNEGNENQGGNENTPGTAVAESAANAINIYAHGNTIIIENATAEIRVYDTMGRLVCRDARPCISTEIRVSTAGLYIVKVGNVAKRVMVN